MGIMGMGRAIAKKWWAASAGFTLVFWSYVLYVALFSSGRGIHYSPYAGKAMLGAATITQSSPPLLLLLLMPVLLILLTDNLVYSPPLKRGILYQVSVFFYWWAFTWGFVLKLNIKHIGTVLRAGYNADLESLQGDYFQAFSEFEVLLFYPTVYCVQQGGGWFFVLACAGWYALIFTTLGALFLRPSAFVCKKVYWWLHGY